MDTGFTFRVWFVDDVENRLIIEVGNFGDRDEVIDLFAFVLEVEASVSESGGEVDDGLTDFVNLLLGGNLQRRCELAVLRIALSIGAFAYHNTDLGRIGIGKSNGEINQR